MKAMRKALCLVALALAAAAPSFAQSEVSPATVPTTPTNVVAAVRDCAEATTSIGVSNEVLFGSEWKLLRPLTKDGELARPDLSLPTRAYRKRGDNPIVLVDEQTEESAKQCRIIGGYADGYDYSRLIVALTKAFGAPQIADAGGARAFKAVRHVVAVKPKETETSSQFIILVQELGE